MIEQLHGKYEMHADAAYRSKNFDKKTIKGFYYKLKSDQKTKM